MAHITNAPNTDLTQSSSSHVRQKAARIAAQLEELIELRHKTEKVEASLKSELKDTLKPAYFRFNESVKNVKDVTHTFDVAGLQVNFVNAYILKNPEHAQTLAKLLGANHPLVSHIQESQKITVDVTGLSPEEANELARDITEDAMVFDVKPQVERATSVSPEFHNLRHVLLTKDDNMELDKVLPMQIQVAVIN